MMTAAILSEPEQAETVLSVRDVTKDFPIKGGLFGWRSVRQVKAGCVSFDLLKGETARAGGESGCGKSTLGRCLLRLVEPTSGEVRFKGTDLATLSANEMRLFRRHLQIVFQDPLASLHPRMRIKDIIAEPLRLVGTTGKPVQERAAELLAGRYVPHRRSGDRSPHGHGFRLVLRRGIRDRWLRIRIRRESERSAGATCRKNPNYP
jgi:peptide/nickel transport system ATP-binding protein/oligopeptide transport system ATP-binding protein